METDFFDSVIIGAGQAGSPLAVKLSQRGERVALIESHHLGGTCVNDGCTPTKTLRKSARVAWLTRRAAEFGVDTGPVTVNFSRAMARMNARIAGARAGLTSWIHTHGVDVIRAAGCLSGKNGDRFVIRAGKRTIECNKVFLNTGTRPYIPPIPGLENTPVLDNRRLLALTECPTHLIVVGGSYIGLEMAQIFCRLGTQVTVIESDEHIASHEDPDISSMLRQMLEDEGISILSGAKITRVSGDACRVNVTLETHSITGSHLFMATGRQPNTENLGLGTIGVETTSQGYIATNERLETNVPGIWALGDINGRGAFTHTSYHDFGVVADNLAGIARSADDRLMAYAVFTDPPLGHAGLHRYEAQALANEGRNILIAEHDMSNISRAKEESELTGRIRIIADGDSGRLLGATVFGLNGDEIIQVFVHFITTGSHWKHMRDTMPVHPTVAEFIPTIMEKFIRLGPQ
ncbi:mercuric reductase [Klebsiella aerogenes]|uniref:mercuric reductase n=1 Tax=Klebsiella aerogenes TaxID=548 RepID=UPI001F2DFD7C|nr:mercuric reductase [Klebsiella aerogenes]